MCGGAFGSGGFGSLGFGSGSIGFRVVRADQIALNAVLVTFSDDPERSDPATAWDALDPGNWSVDVVSPATAHPRLVQYVEAGPESTQVVVYVDGELTGLSTYSIEAADDVRAALGDVIGSDEECRAAQFVTFPPFRVTPEASARRDAPADLANPQLLVDAELLDPPPLGSYQINDRGDFSLERGRPYLRKRIMRRASTAIGEFFHLPNYGWAEPIKGLITPSKLARMAARAQAQILREPDVAAAVVRVFQIPDRPDMVVVDMKVRDTNGNSEQLTVSVPLTL